MNSKSLRIIQIICSIIGMIVVAFFGSLSLMVTASALESEYTTQVIAASLFLFNFLLAEMILLVTIFKPKAFIGLVAIPIIFTISHFLEKASYNVDHIISEVPKHEMIGKDFTVHTRIFLISNLPKKRLRNSITLCKEDYLMSETLLDGFISRLDAINPKVEELDPPQKFTIVGVFVCGKDGYFSVKDSTGRVAEISGTSFELLRATDKPN